MARLRDDGLGKVRSGMTSIAEVARVTGTGQPAGHPGAMPPTPTRPTSAELRRAVAGGALAGLAGAAAMALLTKAEQRFTHRPDSYVPAHTLAGLLSLRRPQDDRTARNWAMHYGTGVSVGVVRGLMAAAGLRGARSAVLFTPLRLTVDQTVENLTGAGAPPWTWPRSEQAIDVGTKATYAVVTGLLADRLVPPARSSALVRRKALGLRLPGFA